VAERVRAPGLPIDWLARLRRALAAAPDHDPAAWRTGGQAVAALPGALELMPPAPQAAAVLVPIVDRPDAPALLLTTRAGHLRHHAGQISFPGGRIEASDASVLGAALRETQEEIGIDPRYIEPLGFLPDHVVLTGFRVTPVVALVHPGFTLQIDATEVADVFELPLEFLSHPGNFRPTRRMLRGIEVTLNDLHFEGRVVWGATAGMLQVLHTLLLQES
jgi:8-oxo-dGTP pyrophosphatase MutT (NUDIX family)